MVDIETEFAVTVLLIQLSEQYKVVPHLIDKDEVIVYN